MSATGRGGDREAFDNYPTPSWCTRRILEALEGSRIVVGGPAPKILEPCVGEGAIVRVIGAYWPRATIIGTDVRATRYTPGGYDATAALDIGGDFDLLITNPPFSVAHEIIQAQRDRARVCAYLLRSSFIAGERAESYRNDMPSEFRLPNRPNFVQSVKCKGGAGIGGFVYVACGWAARYAIGAPIPRQCPQCNGPVQHSSSDASEYSWFVWDTSRRGVGESRVLPRTSAEERAKG